MPSNSMEDLDLDLEQKRLQQVFTHPLLSRRPWLPEPKLYSLVVKIDPALNILVGSITFDIVCLLRLPFPPRVFVEAASIDLRI